jgi:dihydrofolate reductase
VHEGVEAAIHQAQKAAGDKLVIVGGANVIQQALGRGVKYFDSLGDTPIHLEQIRRSKAWTSRTCGSASSNRAAAPIY